MTEDKSPSSPDAPAAGAPRRPIEPKEGHGQGPQQGPRESIVWLSLGILALLFAWNSWERDFWSPDEPRVAQVASVMERGGDWLVPVICGKKVLDSPPLSYWLPAAFHELTGLDPRFSYRLPFVLAAALGLWLTYLTGKKLFDGRVGYLAMVLQASTYSYFTQASRLDDDLLFAVFTQLSLTSFALCTRKGARDFWPLLGWVGLAGCALTKSLFLAVALVLGTLVLFLFFEAGLSGVRRGLQRARSWPGLTFFLAIAAPWYVAVASREGGDLFEMHLVGQHIERLISSPHDSQPPYYYLIVGFLGFLPWALFAPMAFFHGKTRIHRHGERLAFIWAVYMLVLLSIPSSKKPGYILVIWPAISLLVSAGFFEVREWFSLWENYLRQGVFKAVPALMKVPLLVVLGLAVLYVLHLSGRLPESSDPRLGEVMSNHGIMISSLVLAGGASAVVYALSSRVRKMLAQGALPRAAFEVACAAVFLLFAFSFFHEGINKIASSRPLLERFASRISPGSPCAAYGARLPEVFLYLDSPERPLRQLDYPDPKVRESPEFQAIAQFLRQDREAFLVSSKEDIDKLKNLFSSLEGLLNVRDEGLAGWSLRLVLVSNKP